MFYQIKDKWLYECHSDRKAFFFPTNDFYILPVSDSVHPSAISLFFTVHHPSAI